MQTARNGGRVHEKQDTGGPAGGRRPAAHPDGADPGGALPGGGPPGPGKKRGADGGGDLPGKHHRQRQHRPGADHHHGGKAGGAAVLYRRPANGPGGIWPPGYQLPRPFGNHWGAGALPDAEGV